MVMGAFFEPKALCGSTSGRPAGDCGTGGREAAFASTTGAGITGGADSAGALTDSDGVSATGCVFVVTYLLLLCREGRNSANNPNKPTLRIPARMRRRFTQSSEMVRAICPCGSRNRILPRNRGNVRVVVARSTPKHQEMCRC